MTWYYDISGNGNMDVYEDDPEFSGLVTTVQNGGDGFELPGDVKSVMRATWEDNANLGNSPVMDVRAGYILMDMATNDIEEGTPP